MQPFLYRSTRSNQTPVSFSEAVIEGLAKDGGLYIPVSWPKLNLIDNSWINMSYQERCLKILAPFMPEIPVEKLARAIDSAYDEKFKTIDIAHVKAVGDVHLLELFHGKTLAFKDMALSLLPHLMSLAQFKAESSKREIVILTATSGDTGKAALEGFADVTGTQIIVFYPTDGVSDIQKRQMATQTGSNVSVFGITGNFDDAQTAVKSIFSDSDLRLEMADNQQIFSSANSMNIGRLLPQIVYYVSAYYDLVRSGALKLGECLNVTVPTGNFGNILAAYYAKTLGLPLGKLICASNENRVLTDFFETGTYNRLREFHTTCSPSMDIVISSNLERLLMAISGNSCEQVCQWMQDLREEGQFSLSKNQMSMLGDFYAGSCDDSQTLETIGAYADIYDYIADPHTAVALKVYQDYLKITGDATKTLVVATASPLKFSQSVLAAIEKEHADSLASDESQRLHKLSKRMGQPIPESLIQVLEAPVIHSQIIATEDIHQVVRTCMMNSRQQKAQDPTNPGGHQ